MKKIIISALTVVAMVGCAEDEGVLQQGGTEVAFSSSSIETRVNTAGTEWIEGDGVGIFMATTVETTFETVNTNKKYTADKSAETTTFTLDKGGDESIEAICYPNTGYVDFYSYYPYQLDMTDAIYKADVTVQTDPTAIDFMYATPQVNKERGNNIAFEFSHNLAQIKFVLTTRDNVSSLTGITAAIKLPVTADYSVLTGKQIGDKGIALTITLNTAMVSTTEYTASAIVLPDTLETAANITLAVDGRTFEVALPAATVFEAGKIHTYNIAVGNDYVYFTEDSTIVPWGGEEDDASTIYPDETTN